MFIICRGVPRANLHYLFCNESILIESNITILCAASNRFCKSHIVTVLVIFIIYTVRYRIYKLGVGAMCIIGCLHTVHRTSNNSLTSSTGRVPRSSSQHRQCPTQVLWQHLTFRAEDSSHQRDVLQSVLTSLGCVS